MKQLVVALSILMLAGCHGAVHDLVVAHAPETQYVDPSDSVRAFLETIPERLEAGGPMAWLELFEETPAFFMASDGQVAFADRASAETFLEGFAGQVSAMSLSWDSLRIEPLAAETAVFAASYNESITMNDGAVSAFGGYVTGVARSHDGRWKLQNLHWSSPTTDPQ